MSALKKSVYTAKSQNIRKNAKFLFIVIFLCVFAVFSGFAVSVSAEYNDYAGVIHIHSNYSDGAGTIDYIAKIANQQNLDFIIITDHNTFKPLEDGKEGQYKNMLVLIGNELSTEAGHYIVLNISEGIDRKMPISKIIYKVNDSGGLGFIAHPFSRKGQWKNWTIQGFTGIEVYNLSADMFDENRFFLLFKTIFIPRHFVFLSILNRPDESLLKWDELTKERKVVGIAGNNAHGNRILFLNIDPYGAMFKVARTHILSKELTKNSIYESLSLGHCYGSIDLLEDPNGFNFVLKENEKTIGIMGDEVKFSPGLNISVHLPQEAEIRLFKDGDIIKTASGKSFKIDVVEKGIYRVEVFKKDKLWIFSNPIYIR